MKLTNLHPTFLEPATALYELAFPTEERRPTQQWIDLMTSEPAFRARAILTDSNEFCGFITTWHFDNFTYVEHFAIVPDKRNSGIGGQAFDALQNSCKNGELVLEVEIPDHAVAQRRVDFYRRHGMELVDCPYLQPPYHPNEDYLPLRIMSSDYKASTARFDLIKATLHREVYGVK